MWWFRASVLHNPRATYMYKSPLFGLHYDTVMRVDSAVEPWIKIAYERQQANLNVIVMLFLIQHNIMLKVLAYI